MQFNGILLILVFVLIFKNALTLNQLNVLNNRLELCSSDPLTGFTRTGFCETNQYDQGTHLICATVTKDFLQYTKSKGNDLSTPRGRSFPGLKPGNNWCLCVYRWVQAKRDGLAPNVVLSSTNKEAINYLRTFNLTISDLQMDLGIQAKNQTVASSEKNNFYELSVILMNIISKIFDRIFFQNEKKQ